MPTTTDFERVTAERDWILARDKARSAVAERRWGLSSDSLVAHVFDPDAPLREPLDPSDMLACARTVAMAPDHLRSDLDPIKAFRRLGSFAHCTAPITSIGFVPTMVR